MTDPRVLGAKEATYARVRFMEFRSRDDRMLRAWAQFRGGLSDPPMREQAVLDSVPAGGAHAGFWRLLATNNRELGRSFGLYQRFESAEAHVRQLQFGTEALTIQHLRGPTRGTRAWVVLLGEAPVMTCSHWYTSLSSAVASANGALEALRSAVVTNAPDRSDASSRVRRTAHLAMHARTI